LTEAADHGGEHLFGRGVAGEVVGVGEEIAFERGGVRAIGGDELGVLALGGEEFFSWGEAGGFDCLRDVEDVEAFGDGDGDGVDVALEQAGVDLGERGGVVEAVLAGLEGSGLVGAQQVEAVLAADDAGAGELRGDARGGGAGGDFDEGLGVRAEGREEEIREGGCGDGMRRKRTPRDFKRWCPP